MKIRPAVVHDLPDMKALEQACPTASHWTERGYQLLFNREAPDRLVLVAAGRTTHNPTRSEGTEALLGFLVARNLASEWELENIVVAPTARRNGLGTCLLEALLTRAKETQSQSVFLEVRESNTAARRLYENAGFQPTGRRRSYYANPVEDAILYSRTLP